MRCSVIPTCCGRKIARRSSVRTTVRYSALTPAGPGLRRRPQGRRFIQDVTMATPMKIVRSNPPTARAAGAGELFKAADLARLDELLGAIYEGPMESPPWHSALELLQTQLKAKHVTLML